MILQTKLLSYILTNKRILIPAFLVILLIGGITFFTTKCNRIHRAEVERLENNYIAAIRGTRTTYSDKLNSWISTSRSQVIEFNKVHRDDKSAIDSILKINKGLGNKVKKVVEILNQQFEINAELKGRVYKEIIYIDSTYTDTAIIYNHNYVERDTAILQTLTIIRERYGYNNYADYKVKYKPIITTIVNEKKEGKWRIKNIFKRRNKYYEVNVFTNDSILKPINVKHYINKKYDKKK